MLHPPQSKFHVHPTPREKTNLAERHLRRKLWGSLSPSWVILTGSAKMITCTVAFPGVSRLTRGVRIFWFSLFIKSSKSDNLRKTKRHSEHGLLHHAGAVVPGSPGGLSGQPENPGTTCLISFISAALETTADLHTKATTSMNLEQGGPGFLALRSH